MRRRVGLTWCAAGRRNIGRFFEEIVQHLQVSVQCGGYLGIQTLELPQLIGRCFRLTPNVIQVQLATQETFSQGIKFGRGRRISRQHLFADLADDVGISRSCADRGGRSRIPGEQNDRRIGALRNVW